MLSICFLSACKDVQQDKNNELNRSLHKAQAYLQQHQFDPALQEAKHAIEIAPTNLQGHIILANIYGKFGQFNKSIQLLLNFDGDKDDLYYFALIKHYQSAKKYFSASKIFSSQSQWLKKQPEHLQLLQAKQWIEEKKFSLAPKELANLLATKNNTYRIPAKIELAHLYLLNNQTSKSLDILKQINQASPRNVLALQMQGEVYLNKKNYAEAESFLALALNALPSTDFFSIIKVQILQQLMFALNQQGRQSEAMIYAKILADEFPSLNTRQQNYSEAKIAFDKNKLKKSEKILLEILARHPQYNQANTLLGILYYKQNKLKLAEKYLSESIGPELSNSKITEIYAITQLKLNRTTAVQALLESMPEEQYSAKKHGLYILAPH
ncbi:hypothetical protein JI57_03025 [Psychromonas sp. PRT-SC03]|nr:hypothetical protein JI57_03025 [Psychromonas sp. PRT-SC03]